MPVRMAGAPGPTSPSTPGRVIRSTVWIDPDGKVRVGVPLSRNLIADVVFATSPEIGENRLEIDGPANAAQVTAHLSPDHSAEIVRLAAATLAKRDAANAEQHALLCRRDDKIRCCRNGHVPLCDQPQQKFVPFLRADETALA